MRREKRNNNYEDRVKWGKLVSFVIAIILLIIAISASMSQEKVVGNLSYNKNLTETNSLESASTDLSRFTDNSKISSYAREAVSWAVAKKVMSGKDNGTRVDPQGRATRAEAAAMIQNYCNYVGR